METDEKREAVKVVARSICGDGTSRVCRDAHPCGGCINDAKELIESVRKHEAALRAAGLLRDEAREARMREALTRIDALVPCVQRAAGMTRASLEHLVEAIGAEARAALEDKR